jgi:hypothetical protein
MSEQRQILVVGDKSPLAVLCVAPLAQALSASTLSDAN